MSEMPSEIPPMVLPTFRPTSAEVPARRIVCWFRAQRDFGRVIGVIYTHEASCQATGLHYLVLLDAQSPSREIVSCDFAFRDLQHI